MTDLTASETVLQALEAALRLQADAGLLPDVMRNEPLLARMIEFRGLRCSVNLVDGTAGPADIELGAGRGDVDGYDLELRPRVEWIVEGPDKTVRRRVLSDGMKAIYAAVRSLIDSDPPVVNDAEVEACDFSDHAVAGLADVNGVEMALVLLVQSDQPF
jgi:hypothetical protein